MPRFGSTSSEPKKRSGCSLHARSQRRVPRSKPTPIIAFSMPKWSISLEHDGDRVDVVVEVLAGRP